jgi:capsular exopolysaccharide synthesis family protein
MPTNNSTYPIPETELPQEDIVDLRKLFFKLLSYWHFFVLALGVALLCAWLYNRYATTRYRVTSTLLIEEDKKGGAAIGTNQLLEGFGLKAGMQNLDNQILILSSWSLIGRTLDSLSYDIEYYVRGRIKKITLYPKHVITVIQNTEDTLPFDIEFKLKYLGENKFTLDAESKGSDSLNKQASFGEKIEIKSGSFRIKCDSIKWFEDHKETDLYFILHRRDKLLESYRKRLKVEPASREATIVKLSLEGKNKEMDIDFLNKLAAVFLNYNLDKKNKEANRTIEFIESQLVGISDSLSITEENLQKFRSKNMVMNLSEQGKAIITQAMELENERARLVIESNYYNYLEEYLSKDNIGEVPIAPATMGITDPGLTNLVKDLAELQGQYYSKSLGDKNPMQGQMAQRLKNTKDALKETLNGVKRANELATRENKEQIRTINAKAAALPVTERDLLGIERQFKLNDVLYTFLLEKKSEAQIQKASNTPDNEIIDPARPDKNPVSPKTTLSYLIALMAGLGFPFLWIMLADFINYRVRDEEDVLKITDMPIAGHVPHSRLKSPIVVFEEPQSHVAEAFRSLRSRMQFFTKEKKSPVILITSSMPEEGKTFTAINLASVYSLMGKKTVLVGFDLRRPKIYSEFGIGNDQGISTWLIGRDNLEDVIKTTTHENLSIIPAGPVPPNPSELTSSAKTDELLNLLKERFDCIIIDSPPIGTVSDTFYLAALADTCLIIVRMNKTSKDMIERTVNDLKISDIKNSSLVINDIGYEGKAYGYGGKYGYGYGNGNMYGKEKKS